MYYICISYNIQLLMNIHPLYKILYNYTMDIFNEGKELLKDVFYSDIRHFKNFYYLRSVFSKKWYNVIVPTVPPANLDWYMVYKLLDEEVRSQMNTALYIPHHLYANYKRILREQHFIEQIDDVYLHTKVNGGEMRPEGDFKEIDSTVVKEFTALAVKCFPDFPNQAEYSKLCYTIKEQLDSVDDINGKYNYNVLLFVDRNPVAFGSLLFSRRMKLGYIHNVGTHPHYQRKGYFSKIIHYLVHIAAHEEIARIYVNTANHSAAYQGFLKLGFQLNSRYHLFAKE